MNSLLFTVSFAFASSRHWPNASIRNWIRISSESQHDASMNSHNNNAHCANKFSSRWRSYWRALLSLACNLNRTREMRSYFVELSEKLIEPWHQNQWQIDHVKHFLPALTQSVLDLEVAGWVDITTNCADTIDAAQRLQFNDWIFVSRFLLLFLLLFKWPRYPMSVGPIHASDKPLFDQNVSYVTFDHFMKSFEADKRKNQTFCIPKKIWSFRIKKKPSQKLTAVCLYYLFIFLS